MPADERRTVTSPSGKRVRVPVCRAIINGQALDLYNVTPTHLRNYDREFDGVVNGQVGTVWVNGRFGRFETLRIRRPDDFTEHKDVAEAVPMT